MRLGFLNSCYSEAHAKLAAALLATIGGISSALAQLPYEVTKTIGLGYPGPQGGNLACGLVAGPDGTLFGTARGPFATNGNIFRVNADGSDFRTLHLFGNSIDGRGPVGDLMFGPDGALYGTTGFGGDAGFGAIFKIQPNGAGYRLLHSFAGAPTDGSTPRGELILGDDGALYGVTIGGGMGGRGTIFSIRPDGTNYKVVYPFNGVSGSNVRAGLIKDQGYLYGVATDEGRYGFGTVFKLTSTGSNLTVLHNFTGAPDGAYPNTRLLNGSDGWLYGVTSDGGINPDDGLLFRLGKDGSGYQVLHRFDENVGFAMGANLIEGMDGALYGATRGIVSAPWLFRINKDGSGYSRIFTAVEVTDPGGFHGPLLESPDGGELYGASMAGGTNRAGTVFKIGKNGQGLQILTHFPSTRAQEKTPRAPLIQGSDDFFYGTAEAGGASSNGVIFRINASGSDYRILHDFGATPFDGNAPNGLIEGSDGRLYGTTQTGGSNNSGVVFQMQRDGSNYTCLHHSAAAPGSRNPSSPLLEASDGMLYGASLLGGSASRGCIFRLSRAGTGHEIVHNFTGGTADGQTPRGNLVELGNGAVVGVTVLGGTSNRGCIFSMNKNGSGFILLRSFAGSVALDGSGPQAGLLAGNDGRLYGTASGGGSANGGIVFSIGSDGSDYQILRSLGGTSGVSPRSSLVEGLAGTLYGTTLQGGNFGRGTLFAIHRNGSDFRVLWHFGARASDGTGPLSGVTVGKEGALYGVTEAGGSMLIGTVYRMEPRVVRLSIVREGEQARVMWPVTSTQDVLEHSGNLINTTPWSPAGIVSSNASAYEAVIALPPGNGSFLRVSRTWGR